MKIIDFIKNNKVPTVVASVVLVAAIAVGIAFGVVNHKDNVETKPFGDESSSAGSSSTISVPPIEGNSSTESTSSEDSTSSVSETIETNSTPSSEATVSTNKTPSKTQTASGNQSTTISTPVTSTPGIHIDIPPTSGDNTDTGSKWVCPDPAAHGSDDGTFCRSAQEHQENIAEYNRLMEEAQNRKPLVYPPGYDSMTWCTDCEKPFGDGHNGTCYLHWEGDTIVHGNYD